MLLHKCEVLPVHKILHKTPSTVVTQTVMQSAEIKLGDTQITLAALLTFCIVQSKSERNCQSLATASTKPTFARRHHCTDNVRNNTETVSF